MRWRDYSNWIFFFPVTILLVLIAVALDSSGRDSERVRVQTSAHQVPLARAPLSLTLASRREPLAGFYTAKVVRIVDGDTFEAIIRVWFGQEIATLVRIRGIDAPELNAACPGEADRARAARALLEDFLLAGSVRLFDLSSDKYFGRVVARVEIAYPDGQFDNAADLMLAADMARPYEGRARHGWCDVALAAN